MYEYFTGQHTLPYSIKEKNITILAEQLVSQNTLSSLGEYEHYSTHVKEHILQCLLGYDNTNYAFCDGELIGINTRFYRGKMKSTGADLVEHRLRMVTPQHANKGVFKKLHSLSLEKIKQTYASQAMTYFVTPNARLIEGAMALPGTYIIGFEELFDELSWPLDMQISYLLSLCVLGMTTAHNEHSVDMTKLLKESKKISSIPHQELLGVLLEEAEKCGDRICLSNEIGARKNL